MMWGVFFCVLCIFFVMFNLDFMLIGEYVELYNFFKIIGFVDSGGIVKLIVVFGVVKVDGVVELCKICKICVG